VPPEGVVRAAFRAGPLFGISEPQSNALRTLVYFVIVDAHFTWFLVGNPEMPKYRKWASDIATGLESQFDERAVWSKARDYALFRREIALQSIPSLRTSDRK
jgi:hypothetical protein